MLTVNGFCCTIFDPQNHEGREIPQHAKLISAYARFANAWSALEDFKNLDIKNIPEECFFGISLCRAGKPGSHPTDPGFSPDPFEFDSTKDAKAFIFVNGELLKEIPDIDRLRAQENFFPLEANRDAEPYGDYDNMTRACADLPKVELDALYFNSAEDYRRETEGLDFMPYIYSYKELRNDNFFVEVVIVPHSITAMPVPTTKADTLSAITAFPHLAHFRFAFKRSNYMLARCGYMKAPSFVHETNVSDAWGPSISGRSKPMSTID